jgi:hypothetical protein
MARSGPAESEGFGDLPLQGAQAGSGGSSSTSSRAIWSRSASRRFFSRRSARSSTPGIDSARQVDQAVEVGMLDAQLDQPTLRRLQVLFHGIRVHGWSL